MIRERDYFCYSASQVLIEDILCNIKYGIFSGFQKTFRKRLGFLDHPSQGKTSIKNISKEEYIFLETLENNHDVVVLKFEKGGAIVILNKIDYIEKIK
jgi:hypothetical protein